MDPLTSEYPDWTPYHYALNNPVIFIDPMGLCPEKNSSDNCEESNSIIFTGENARALFRVLVKAKNTFDYTKFAINEASETAIESVRFVASEGPEFLDTVGDAAAQTTMIAGSATAYSLKTPTFLDTKASASATILFGGITLSTDFLATGLSGFDAALNPGDSKKYSDFRARLWVSTVGISVTAGSGLLFKRQLRQSILNPEIQRTLNTTATTNTSKTATDPLRNR